MNFFGVGALELTWAGIIALAVFADQIPDAALQVARAIQKRGWFR